MVPVSAPGLIPADFVFDSSTRFAYSKTLRDIPVSAIEMPSFLKKAGRFFDDDERAELAFYIASNEKANRSKPNATLASQAAKHPARTRKPGVWRPILRGWAKRSL
jgi:hypothetical protein